MISEHTPASQAREIARRDSERKGIFKQSRRQSAATSPSTHSQSAIKDLLVRVELTKQNLMAHTNQSSRFSTGGNPLSDQSFAEHGLMLPLPLTIGTPSSIPDGIVSRTRSRSLTKTLETTLITASSKKMLTGNRGFRETYLIPRGIVHSDQQFINQIAATHFGDIDINQAFISSEADRQVWLDTTIHDIQQVLYKFNALFGHQMKEAVLAQFARETFFHAGSFLWPIRGNTVVIADRMIEQDLKPGSGDFAENWIAPPVIDPEHDGIAAEFKFDIRTDTIYWLSMACFSSKHRSRVRDFVHVHKNARLCPYFTIELKCNGCNNLEAENQIAIAGSIALYNRCLLKKSRLVAKKKKWTNKHNVELRHYALTLLGS